MATYTHTSTYTSARIDVVAKQFERGLFCAGLSHKRIEKILAAIKEKKIAAIGIYALDYDKKRIAEVEISVDWTKHENLIKVYGNQFECLGAINGKTGEAAEPKVYVNSLVQLAKDNDFELSCWIRVTDAVRKDSGEYKKTLRTLGFGGGKIEDWRSKPENLSSEKLLAIEEMQVDLRAVNGDSMSRRADLNSPKKDRLDRASFSVYFNLVAMTVLILALILDDFNLFAYPLKNVIFVIPMASSFIYFIVVDLWSENKYGGWTMYDTVLVFFLGLECVAVLLYNMLFTNSLLFAKIYVIIVHIYVIPVFMLTTHRINLFQAENGIPEKQIEKYSTLAYFLSGILIILLVKSAIVELKALSSLAVNDVATYDTYEQGK